jgi:hypothetical protein
MQRDATPDAHASTTVSGFLSVRVFAYGTSLASRAEVVRLLFYRQHDWHADLLPGMQCSARSHGIDSQSQPDPPLKWACGFRRLSLFPRGAIFPEMRAFNATLKIVTVPSEFAVSRYGRGSTAKLSNAPGSEGKCG